MFIKSFGRWVWSFRGVRPWLVAFGILGLLLAIFYAKEDWLGHRAWNRCRREMEAKGAVLDWNAYLPPRVANNQNFYAAPKMQKWFTGRGSTELSGKLGAINSPWHPQTNAVIIMELTLAKPGDPSPPPGETVVHWDAPQARAQLEKLYQDALGPNLIGPLGFTTLARPVDSAHPRRVTLLAEKFPASQDLEELLSTETRHSGHYVNGNTTLPRVKSSSTNSYQITLFPAPWLAADCLKAANRLNEEFAMIREAVQRPFARIEGDYEHPASIPIPNFVTLRCLAQALSELAQCHLLLGRPDEALQDLTLIHDVCTTLEARPSGKPMTLIATMINCAIQGLSVGIVADGLRLDAWQEPQLAALEKQLGEVNLLPLLLASFHFEQAADSRIMETLTAQKWRSDQTVWKNMQEPTYWVLLFGPRGWVYQNMAIATRILQTDCCESLDVSNQIVFPQQYDNGYSQSKSLLAYSTPHNFLVGQMIPNFSRAIQNLAKYQTHVNEARIVCALERYHLAQGTYPPTLETLTPRFIDKIPRDLIGGQPLKYRAEHGQFLLYSIGWNERDDGGTTATNRTGGLEPTRGDWVWPYKKPLP